MTGVPVDEQCTLPGCHNRRVNPHPDSLCAEHYPGDPPDRTAAGSADVGLNQQKGGDDSRVLVKAEARAVAGPDDRHPDVEVVDPGSEPPGEFSLADAMGDTDGLPDADPTKTASTATTASSGSLGEPMSALPLGQLDALDPDDRRRAARRRGLGWPSTDEARERLFDTVATVMREADVRVVDAPTSLGKTHTVAATRWGARDDLTGDRPVVHLLETRDARDEAVGIAEEYGGEHLALLSRTEACPVAGGDYDPDEVADDPDREPVTVEGVPASEWIEERCEGRGIHFSAVHRELEKRNDRGRDLPCCADGECRALAQWDDYREGDYPLVVATHNFAYAPGLRMHNNLVVDEAPDYRQDDLTTDRVRRAVTAYLQAIDASVGTWEELVTVATGDGDLQETARKHGLVEKEYREGLVEDLQEELGREPDRKWYFRNADAHTLAPALARAVLNAEPRRNGRRVGKTRYEPPRLDGEARDDDTWNREWVSVILDESNEVRTVRAVPDFGAARSVIGLDAHPALPVWQANTHPDIQRTPVLDPEERQLWRRYERGLRVVQVGDATRPLASGEYFDPDGCRALAEHLREEYGDDFRTAITAKSVEDRLAGIMRRAGIDGVETMHYGAEKSRNDFAPEAVGLVNGSIDPGDDHILDLLAELDLDATPERSDGACEHCDGEGCRECLGTGHRRSHGRGFEGADADTAQAILASVRENHVAQAAGRYARHPDDPSSTATVYVRTDALPPGFADIQVPGVVWTYGAKQDRVVEVLREAEEPLPARTIADRADCSKEHVRTTLQRLEDADGVDDVQAFDGAGDHGATLYATDGVPNSGVVDLGEIANSPVWDSYTWQLAIRPSEASAAASTRPEGGGMPSTPVSIGGDRPPDDAD